MSVLITRTPHKKFKLVLMCMVDFIGPRIILFQ